MQAAKEEKPAKEENKEEKSGDTIVQNIFLLDLCTVLHDTELRNYIHVLFHFIFMLCDFFFCGC